MPIVAATVAGLTTGSIGLTITLYKSALDVYSVFATASSLGADAQVLQAQLLIQETLFRRWGEGLGLRAASIDDVDERLKSDDGEGSLFQATVVALSSIRKLLSDVQELRKTYGLEGNDERTSGNQLLVELHNMSLTEATAVSSDYDLREEDAAKIQKRIGIMKKLTWVVKDKEKFEKLLQRLTGLNNGLYTLIQPVEASIIAKAVVAELLRTTDLKRLEILNDAARNRGSNNTVDIAGLAILRHRAIEITMYPNQVPDMELPDSSRDLILPPTSFGERRTIGSYQCQVADELTTQPVLIEWKTANANISGTDKTRLDANTNKLAYFLSEGQKSKLLRSLACIGVTKPAVHSAEAIRYGLVYSVPGNNIEVNPPVSLSQMLARSEDEMDLGDKFRMAQALVQSIHELHLARWLHKAISSDNVLLFRRNTSSRYPRFSAGSMYLAGYEFSRPGRLRDPTEPADGLVTSIYAHPDYQPGHTRFQTWFDVYSLGVVLLEIGLWQKAAAGIRPGQTPSDVQNFLIESCEELGPAMGITYRDAVVSCLTGNFMAGLIDSDTYIEQTDLHNPDQNEVLNEHDERLSADMIESFYSEVVRPLRKLYA